MKSGNDKIKDAVLFLKWAGGKRQLLPELEKYVPEKYSNYCEPFLGGGALLFHLQPAKALVNDTNAELINVYRQIKGDVEGLIKELRKHVNSKEYFYKIRSLDRKPGYSKLNPIARASRTKYLNRTCFNGLYRVNSKNEFNVPFGKYKNPNIVNEKNLRSVSRYLNENNVKFECTDFSGLEKKIVKGSFVYVDPPYQPLSRTSSFTSYTNSGFGAEDQKRLKEFCRRLIMEKGCYVLISNSYTDYIRNLYSSPAFQIKKINAARHINSVGHKRGKIPEALIIGK